MPREFRRRPRVLGITTGTLHFPLAQDGEAYVVLSLPISWDVGLRLVWVAQSGNMLRSTLIRRGCGVWAPRPIVFALRLECATSSRATMNYDVAVDR